MHLWLNFLIDYATSLSVVTFILFLFRGNERLKLAKSHKMDNIDLQQATAAIRECVSYLGESQCFSYYLRSKHILVIWAGSLSMCDDNMKLEACTQSHRRQLSESAASPVSDSWSLISPRRKTSTKEVNWGENWFSDLFIFSETLILSNQRLQSETIWLLSFLWKVVSLNKCVVRTQSADITLWCNYAPSNTHR